jgi:2,4-dienoyl-CoA reductase (NADPH2)
MEAARLAAEQGHRVTLLEKQRRLGGSLVLAATVHSDNQPFLDFLKAELKRLAVTVQLGVEPTPADIAALLPDMVIVASGAKVRTPAITGSHLPGVMTGEQLRHRIARLPSWLQPLVVPSWLRVASKLWLPIGKKVVICGADLAATELAEFLARRGRRVHLLESGTKIAPEVGKKRRAEHMDRLDKLHVTLNTRVEILAIASGGVKIRSANRTERLIYADSIIIAGNPCADTSLAEEMAASGLHVVAIGDCTGLGLIAGATRDAAEAVAQLAMTDTAAPVNAQPASTGGAVFS